MTPEQLVARKLEIELQMHYQSYVVCFYQLTKDHRKAFVDHMNLVIPPERIEPRMDWSQYWFEMLKNRVDPAYRKEAMNYAYSEKKLTYRKMQRIFAISPNLIKSQLSGEPLVLIPPNPKWMPQLLQVNPLWQGLKKYEFDLW